jgi:2-polyprenyl-6-methoxyphenol hydroxylase-like FAD-dependent oxidoreductase
MRCNKVDKPASTPPLNPTGRALNMAKFKSIIVGGGPVGMLMAHALSLADIDFVVVEKRDTISTWTGAGLSMWAHGMRILHQLRLRDALRPAGAAVDRQVAVRPDGAIMGIYPQPEE